MGISGSMNDIPATSYDEIPYPSRAYCQTRPERLAAVARLFGMEPANFRKARVLELGCASGGNLIPMAAAYPESHFVGIDLSKKQIDESRKAVDDLGLNNIEMKHFSISDVDRSFGTFDYIIAHGIYSWVPEDVRDAIITVCKQNLTRNGIAYVSYNTLPGWNMVKTIRDMMFYHVQNFSDAGSKILEARRMLDFAINNSSGGDSPYKKILQMEATLLRKVDDNYLYHDHLEHHNEPCYFHEFMSKATAKGLNYLGDSTLSTMYLGNHAEQAREILVKVDDIVRQEQYFDFLTNRRFRSTLLCHAEVALSRNVTNDRLEGLCYGSSLVPKDGFDTVDLTVDESIKFENPVNKVSFTTHNRTTTALMYVLAENKGHPVSLDDLVAEVRKRLENVSEDVIRRTFLENAGVLIFGGALTISSDAGFQRKSISERPKAWSYSRYVARSKNLVPNVLHDNAAFGDDLRVLIQYVDGTRTDDELADALMKHFLGGELNCLRDDVPVTEDKELRPLLKELVKTRLRYLADSAYLVG